jgi:hypothetical protein
MSSPESESEENGVLRESGDIPLYDDTVFEEEELEEDTKVYFARLLSCFFGFHKRRVCVRSV